MLGAWCLNDLIVLNDLNDLIVLIDLKVFWSGRGCLRFLTLISAYRQKKRTVAIDRARTQFALKLQRLLEGRQDFRQVLHVRFLDIRHPALGTRH